MIRPKYSLRTLTIAITLLCAYFGSWEITKRFGVRGSPELLLEYEQNGTPIVAAITPPAEMSPLPFVIRRAVYGYMHGTYEYYVWFFGLRLRVPYERSIAKLIDTPTTQFAVGRA